jgi:hypothetical protein
VDAAAVGLVGQTAAHFVYSENAVVLERVEPGLGLGSEPEGQLRLQRQQLDVAVAVAASLAASSSRRRT